MLRRFLSHLLLFLHLDSGVPQGVTQQVTHKVAQHLTGASHGDNVKLLNSMIQVRVPPAPKCTLACLLITCPCASTSVCFGHFRALGTVLLAKEGSRSGFLMELDVILFVF